MKIKFYGDRKKKRKMDAHNQKEAVKILEKHIKERRLREFNSHKTNSRQNKQKEPVNNMLAEFRKWMDGWS